MHQRRKIQGFTKQILTVSLIAILLLITPGFAQTAQADDLSLVATAQDFSHRIAEADRADQQFQNFVDDTYSIFLRSVERTQNHLKSQSHQRVTDFDRSSRESTQAIGSLGNNTDRMLNGKGSWYQNS